MQYTFSKHVLCYSAHLASYDIHSLVQSQSHHKYHSTDPTIVSYTAKHVHHIKNVYNKKHTFQRYLNFV